MNLSSALPRAWALRGMLLSVLFLASCAQQCGEAPPDPKAPTPAPEPKAAPPTSRVLSRVPLGASPGNAVAHPDALVASVQGRGELLILSRDQKEPTKLSLGTSRLGGIYLGTDGKVRALEAGGRKLWRVQIQGGKGAVESSVDLDASPRLLAEGFRSGVEWVLMRDSSEPLRKVKEGKVERFAVSGSTHADLEANTGKTHLWIANLASHDLTILDLQNGKSAGSLPVSAEPFRLVALPGEETLAVLHTNSDKVTLVDTLNRSVKGQKVLPWLVSRVVPSHNGERVAWVGAGAGKIQVEKRGGEDSQELSVPVGSGEVVWYLHEGEERLLVSTGTSGQVQVWGGEPGAMTLRETLEPGFATGRILVGEGNNNVWVLGPQSGQAAQLEIR